MTGVQVGFDSGANGPSFGVCPGNSWVTWCWLPGGEVLVTGGAIGWWSYRHVERHLFKFQEMQEELREDLSYSGE